MSSVLTDPDLQTTVGSTAEAGRGQNAAHPPQRKADDITQTDPTRSILARLAALVLGVGVVWIPTTPVSAAGGPAAECTTWPRVAHPGCADGYFGIDDMPRPTERNTRVDNFDITGLVQQLKSVGAGWLQLSAGQNTALRQMATGTTIWSCWLRLARPSTSIIASCTVAPASTERC
ncbi:hypothetical protein HTZ77_29830 [Nonomuraea sp. SMC257]|uniref:Uncharacterized protein n=1 Tax=Nonomuraea montanisoli TaxID=2741721 RepID=A0A7Y6M6G6_9ACTN|nr:hypothetical protein [Nonomuraea montanisoli]NUW35600.1 hypothetical protein [Nonomuraea montanisoli]